MNFQHMLSDFVGEFEPILARALPMPAGPQSSIMDAMHYAALKGGKRLRPFLLVECCSLFGGRPEPAMQAGAALECLHVYSLIHDDLPCMDDDDFRRGKPAVHKKYDEAIAVLAGDALLTLSFEIIAGVKGLSPSVRLELITQLAMAGGTHGMIGGQVIDIRASGQGFGPEVITQLQALKTGALIRYACRAGGIIAQAPAADIQRLDAYGGALGLAFQIKDDILDVEGSAEALGKAVGKDGGHDKATFVAEYGLSGAKAKMGALAEEAYSALDKFGVAADRLRGAVGFVLNRQK